MLSAFERWNLLLQVASLVSLLLLGLRVSDSPVFLVVAWLIWSTALGFCHLFNWTELRNQNDPLRWAGRHGYSFFTLLFAPMMLVHIGWLALLAFPQVVFVVRTLGKWNRSKRWAMHLLERPAQLLTLSFLGLVMVGTLLLKFPAATPSHHPISWIEALFTATSASCVTGLAVLDTPNDFSLFGQLVILALIQIGGFGTMTLSSFIIWLIGRRLGLLSQTALSELLDEPTPSKVMHLLRTIFVATLLIECVGAIILYVSWYKPSWGVYKTMYMAWFHSISAFCNAGFSLWSNSLIPYQSDVVVNFTIMMLIISGGLGFPVFASLISDRQRRHLIKQRSNHKLWHRIRLYIRTLPLNTKIALTYHPFLILLAFVLLLPLEWDHSLHTLSTGGKVLAGLFQAVTLRTAGFNTIDFSLLTNASLFLMILFMFVGGCSGGTAGGLKVNTISVLFFSLRATLRGRSQTEAFSRTLPQATVTRAIVVFFAFLAFFFLGLFLMLLTHPKIPFSHVLFEVTSALGTVGLTTATADGASTTSKLTPIGRLLITFLMFIGRIGPLTMALAISEKPKPGQYQFPRERIYVG